MASHSHITTSSSAARRTSGSAPKTKQLVNGKAQVISQLESSSIEMPSSSSQSSKRKRNTATYEAGEDSHEYDHDAPPKKKGKKNDEEKRLRVHRKKPPKSFIDRLERVRTQRMFLIDRNRSLTSDGTQEEVFDIAGTTGNIYQIKIGKVPSCTCPDAVKENQCKHIIYVLVNILKAPEELTYQLALLSKELVEIFSNAPATPQSSTQEEASSTDTGGKRKPIEGDCPVCVMEFQEKDDIVWCKAACGNNIHRQCFEQWARTKPGQVKCVYCRTVWKGDEKCVQRIAKSQLSEGKVNREGYVNVASQLGISGQRDTSTYHQPWVHQRPGGYRGYRSWQDYNDDNSYDDYAPGEGF